MSDTIVHVMIRGRVQGVGYRAWVEHQALAAGLEGWVRNRRDGSVEAVFAGAAELVANMVARCHRGPPSARVDAVIEEAASSEQLGLREPGESFSVLGTV